MDKNTKETIKAAMIRAAQDKRHASIAWHKCKCGVSHNETKCPMCGTCK